MTGGVVRRLTGYELTTERLAFRRDIPEESWNEARSIARLPIETELALAAFPITDDQARRIAALVGETLPPERMEFFLEPFAAGPPKQATTTGRG